ncbi:MULTISPECIES: hypothetical protein [unclassified Lentimonas]|uniref:hypothetical protein n=1 Tax=unclassified Lentimonas TaxID=2630993 RepID=UPI00138A37B4|nr:MULTISPECIES: hypothetical protein [unclassified Lentimonas]
MELKHFREISPIELCFSLLGFCGIIAPGVLSIWMYAPALITAATTPKLILLALSITIPLCSFNAAFILLARKEPKTEKERYNRHPLESVIVGIIFGAIAFIPSVVLKLFIPLPLWIFALLIVAVDLFFLVGRSRGGIPLYQPINSPDQK